ncbi:tenascin-like isoform X5 [Thrips palmi]|uniref:Tenascin-like isoform X5 n=1 Tax=Thrips palmi TaxID=161013 RepID=A0A6P8YWQ7_THRPL|nr:tenascin-like isoform X5 [Thrips palmi]
MGQLVAAPALNSTKGAISVQVLPPLLPKCSANADCVSLLGQHSACRDYWCECVDGAKYESGFSKRCLRVVSAIGDSCKEAGDCRRIANTYCKAGRCHCNKDFVFSDSGAACLKVATAENPSCSEDRQCVRLLNSATGPDGPAVCVDGKCMCRYDHVFENGTCVHKQARGKSCAADAECADLDGGACVQGVCGCKTNFVPAVAANKCLPVQRSLAAACEEDIQCSEGLGDLGRCSAGKCACPDGAVLGADNKCACADDEELNKAANRCEKAAPGKQLQQQQPAKEGQLRDNKGGAGSLQSSATVVIALLACAAYSLA